MTRRLGTLLVLVVAGALAAAPAALADAPFIERDLQIHQVVQNPAACGSYGVVWDINISADRYTYFDSEGRRIRVVTHLREDNTIMNTVTGLTLREGPDSLIQTAYFDPETQALQSFAVSGLQARVGNEIMDVGRVILLPLGGGRLDLVFAAGRHPVREEADLGTLRDALPAFCEVLA